MAAAAKPDYAQMMIWNDSTVRIIAHYPYGKDDIDTLPAFSLEIYGTNKFDGDPGWRFHGQAYSIDTALELAIKLSAAVRGT